MLTTLRRQQLPMTPNTTKPMIHGLSPSSRTNSRTTVITHRFTTIVLDGHNLAINTYKKRTPLCIAGSDSID
jgi:hypothetical protein